MRQILRATLMTLPLLIFTVNTGSCSFIDNEDNISQNIRKKALKNVAWFLYHEPNFQGEDDADLVRFITKTRAAFRSERGQIRHDLKLIARIPQKKLHLDTWISKKSFLFDEYAPSIKENLNDWLDYWSSPTMNEIRGKVLVIIESN